MDWKEQLNKKEKELNLIKGGNDGQIVSSSIVVNRNDSRSSGNVHRVSIYQEINNVKEREEKRMITVEGALSDLDKLIVEADNGSKSVLKGIKVLVKFLSTMRSNQLLTEDDKKRIAADKAKRPKKEEK